MQAIHMTAVGGPQVLQVVDVPEPEVLPGCVRFRNRATAINFHDFNTRRGDDPAVQLPMIPGSDFAGVVDAVGEGVDHVRVGDRVVGIAMGGAYAEATMTLAPLVIPIPDDVTFAQAASCPVAGLTAYFMTRQLVRIEPGMPVAVYAAAGSVGCFMGAMLREVGAVSIGIVGSAEKAEVARHAGYTHIVNYRTEDLVIVPGRETPRRCSRCSSCTAPPSRWCRCRVARSRSTAGRAVVPAGRGGRPSPWRRSGPCRRRRRATAGWSSARPSLSHRDTQSPSMTPSSTRGRRSYPPPAKGGAKTRLGDPATVS